MGADLACLASLLKYLVALILFLQMLRDPNFLHHKRGLLFAHHVWKVHPLVCHRRPISHFSELVEEDSWGWGLHRHITQVFRLNLVLATDEFVVCRLFVAF